MRRIIFATAAVLIAASAPTFVFARAPAAAPVAKAGKAAITAAVDRIADAALAKGASPGLQIAIFRNGAPILVKSYGLVDLEQRTPVTNESVFRIGSVTKQFTAAAILKLQEEAKLSVDDRLFAYFPDFPGAEGITIRQMLQHTSGLHSFTDKNYPAMKMAHRSTAEMVGFLAAMPKVSDFAPGTDWRYSNTAYFMLGAIVEKVEGASLAAVLERRFFVPLGMTRTAVDDESEIVAGRARGYAPSGPGKFRNAGYLSMTVPGGAGAIRSTASDLARWNAALFGGKVLKSESLAAMTAPGRLANGETTAALIRKIYDADRDYGFGLEISTVEGHRRIEHGGGIDGFSSNLAEYPEDRTTVVILSNTIGKNVGSDTVTGPIERIVLGLPAAKEAAE